MRNATACPNGTEVKETHEETAVKLDADQLILFPVICLGLGLVLDASQTRIGCKRFRIPATVLQLVVAFVLSILMNNYLFKESLLYKITHRYTWVDQEPHAIMLLLLPIIIFESSFKMDNHHFMQKLIPIICLATIGFLLSSLLLGSLMILLMVVISQREHWTIVTCFAYGAIVSATDPVAVVALLQQLGVPGDLQILLEGESLMNDGAAIVSFNLLQLVIRQERVATYSVNWVHTIFVQVIGVAMSLCIGFIAAHMVIWLIMHAVQDLKKEVTILLITIYGTFSLCESISGSGVLCLVVVGVSLSNAHERLNPKTAEAMAHIYSFFAYFCNCIAFVHSGLVIGKIAVEIETKHMPYEIGFSLLIYIFSLISRSVAVAVIGATFRFYQVLKNQTKLKGREIFIIFWGGLRGAVALLLAVQLRKKELDIDKSMTHDVLLYVGMTVFLSLLVQAASFEQFVKWLKLNKHSVYKGRRLHQRLQNLYYNFAKKQLKYLQSDKKYYYLSSASWTTVWKLSQNALLPGRFSLLEEEPESQSSLSESDSTPQSTKEFAQEAVKSYLNLFKSRVWHMWEKGLFSRKTVRLMIHYLDRSLDKLELLNVNTIINAHVSWECTQKLMRNIEHSRILHRSHPRSLDWWRIISFIMLSLQFVCTMLLLLTAILEQFLFATIFFLSLFFITEHLTLGFYYKGWFRKMSTIAKLETGCDVLFFVYYAILLVLLGMALSTAGSNATRLAHCLLKNECMEYSKFEHRSQFCNGSYWFAVIGISVRFALKAPLAVCGIVKLLAEVFHKNVQLKQAYNLSTLNAMIRIAEDVKFGLLSNVIPGEELLLVASQQNMSLRKTAELVLMTIMRDPKNLHLYRWAETRQASRIILVAILEDITRLQEEGGLTVEEVKELENRMENAFSNVYDIKPTDVGAAQMHEQLRRVSWIMNSKAELPPEEVIDFLMYDCGLIHVKSAKKDADNMVPPDFVFFHQGDERDGMYFLNAGICEFFRKPLMETTSPPERRFLYPGTWFGERAVLMEKPFDSGRYGTVTASTYCSVYFLPLTGVKKLLRVMPSIRLCVTLKVALLKCRNRIRLHKPYHTWTDTQIDSIIQSSQNLWVIQDETVTSVLPYGKCAIILQGEIQTEFGTKIVEASRKEIQLCSKTFSVSSISASEPAILVIFEDLNSTNLLSHFQSSAISDYDESVM